MLHHGVWLVDCLGLISLHLLPLSHPPPPSSSVAPGLPQRRLPCVCSSRVLLCPQALWTSQVSAAGTSCLATPDPPPDLLCRVLHCAAMYCTTSGLQHSLLSSPLCSARTVLAEYSGAALATVLTLFLGRRGHRVLKVLWSHCGGGDMGRGGRVGGGMLPPSVEGSDHENDCS